MPYRPHTLVTFGGTNEEQAADDEIWQCGIRGLNPAGGGNTPVDPGQFQTYLDAVTTPLSDWMSSGVFHNANTALLRWIKIVNIGADGRYSSDPLVKDGLDVGGGGSPNSPSFTTVCYSWETGRSAGRARRGRVYPPNYAAPRGPGATVTTSAQADLLAGAVALLTAIADQGDQYQFVPHVMSSSGAFNPINGARVGNVYDVQRRRKDAVPEVYVAQAWAPF
jgi:hypothetical protein